MTTVKIVLATANRHKAAEMRAVLEPLLPPTVSFSSLLDLEAFDAPEETGATFEQNAMLKALHGADKTGCLCIADDSGLCVDSLAGAPGIFSSRWAGREATDRDRIEKLLRSLSAARAVTLSQRSARFVCAAAAAAPDGWSALADGSCGGVIIAEPRGAGGFGYDPIFLLPDLDRTMAELAPQEKNRLSHRGRALCALAPIVAAYLDFPGGPLRA